MYRFTDITSGDFIAPAFRKVQNDIDGNLGKNAPVLAG